MTWGYVAAGTATVAGSLIGANAAGNASKEQVGASKAARQFQEQQQAQVRADLYPWLDAGRAALAEQRKQLGLPPLDQAKAPRPAPTMQDLKLVPNQQSGKYYYDPRTGQGYSLNKQGENAGLFIANPYKYEHLIDPALAAEDQQQEQGAAASQSGSRYGAFETSPGYLFNRDEGDAAINRQMAAKGRSFSGASLRAATRYAAGLASQEYDNYYNRLANLSGTGQQTGQQLGDQSMAAVDNIGSAALYSGASRASSIASRGDLASSAIGQLGGIFADYWDNRKKTPPTTSGGFNPSQPNAFAGANSWHF